MAEEFNEGVPVEEQAANPGGDVEMGEGQAGDEAAAADEGGTSTGDLPFAEGGEADPRPTFISYLTSPVVTLIVGTGDNETILTAHQALLIQSPFFAEACAAFTNDGSVRWTQFIHFDSYLQLTLTIYLYSRDKLNSPPTKPMLSAASSSSSTRATTSPGNYKASVRSNPILRCPKWTRLASNS